MRIMLDAEISNTLTKDMTYRYRLRVTQELEFFVELITELKGDPFHPETSSLTRRRTNCWGDGSANPTHFDKKWISPSWPVTKLNKRSSGESRLHAASASLAMIDQ